MNLHSAKLSLSFHALLWYLANIMHHAGFRLRASVIAYDGHLCFVKAICQMKHGMLYRLASGNT